MQSGDTVWGLAQQYHSTVDAITSRNQLANPAVIQIGQRLIIPDSASGSANNSSTTTGSVAGTIGTKVSSASAVITGTNSTMTSTADSAASDAVLTSANGTSTVNGLDSAAAILSSSPTSAATSSAPAASQTSYEANSAAALQAMSTYTISYGTVASTAAATNGNTASQTGSATQATNQSTQTANTGQSTSSAVATAQSMIGVPYVWGGNTPSGFDCSGLVQYAYNLGSNYRTTYQQTNLGQHKYDVENAQSGDLYFWGTESAPYHVAIAEGNGNYIQAPTPGQNVQEGNIQYYRPNYYISMGQ